MARDPAVHRANNATSYKQSSADAAAPGSLPRLRFVRFRRPTGQFFQPTNSRVRSDVLRCSNSNAGRDVVPRTINMKGPRSFARCRMRNFYNNS